MAEQFTNFIECEKIFFKHARGASVRSGTEFHPLHEIILFLGGEAELISETVNTRLQPDTLVIIPKETYHQVEILGKQTDYHRCVLNFDDDPSTAELMQSRFNELTLLEYSDGLRCLFGILMTRAAKSEGLVPDFELLRSTLTLILHEAADKGRVFENQSRLSDATQKAILYIEKNLHRTVSVAELARLCNISPSSLSHNFKQEMHISVYQYILKKRLVLAYDKISHGQPATVAAYECGFQDYSGFYKQYKKMFGISPSGK